MTQRFYQKASVQTAIVSGIFGLVIGVSIQYLENRALDETIEALRSELDATKADLQSARDRTPTLEMFEDDVWLVRYFEIPKDQDTDVPIDLCGTNPCAKIRISRVKTGMVSQTRDSKLELKPTVAFQFLNLARNTEGAIIALSSSLPVIEGCSRRIQTETYDFVVRVEREDYESLRVAVGVRDASDASGAPRILPYECPQWR